ncbi:MULTISPECIES: hypothetical protein [Bacteria]|uniref:hypothetical protein n=1 Tax=Bacteria TaxID=2 RepID=UPI003C799A4A
MSTETYTGKLSDIGLGVLTPARPVMKVAPEVEAFSPTGLVSAIPVPVDVNPLTGAFSMKLFPSGELTAAQSGRVGVDYVISVGRFEDTVEGTVFHGMDVWRFTAVAGGGDVGGMAGGSLLAVWIGPPWPSPPLPKGLYIDLQSPNPWGIVS